jgi:hypothetical protein
MPICEADPWRVQYFEGIACPDDVNIPTEDGDAWRWYPKYKWVYNKLAVAESQNLVCAPHGIDPDNFPVFSKPIYNMRGMGAGSGVLRTEKEYKYRQRPGHMWMQLLQGEHVSTDVAVVTGDVKWQRHSVGQPLEEGMFDYWTVLAEKKPRIENYLVEWVRTHLPDYSGMLNFETIDARIIEVHMRFADQWPDLYGAGWVEALIRLYAGGTWEFDDSNRIDGYSVVLFGTHGVQYRHPPVEFVERLRATDGVLSVQITFHEDRPPASHSMPPGGFRLAIVNTPDLELGRKIRQELALSFWSTQQLLQRRRRKAE